MGNFVLTNPAQGVNTNLKLSSMDKFYKCVLLALTALLTLAGGHRSGLAANNDANAAFAQPAGPEQAVTVRGIVKDGNGPVIGASVIEKGTTNGKFYNLPTDGWTYNRSS